MPSHPPAHLIDPSPDTLTLSPPFLPTLAPPHLPPNAQTHAESLTDKAYRAHRVQRLVEDLELELLGEGQHGRLAAEHLWQLALGDVTPGEHAGRHGVERDAGRAGPEEIVLRTMYR